MQKDDSKKGHSSLRFLFSNKKPLLFLGLLCGLSLFLFSQRIQALFGLVLFFLAPWLSATFQGIPDMRGELPMTLFSTITTVVLLFVGTFAFPDKSDEKPGLDAFFARI